MSIGAWPQSAVQEPVGTGWRHALIRRLAPAHTLLLALIFIGAVAIGWAVLPGEDERIEALERDGQTARALALLRARFERGDHRQRTLVSLRRFYEYYGDSDNSLRMLQLLTEQRPRDLYLLRQLAQFYRQIEDVPGQVRALRSQLAVRYSEPVCQRLIGLLRGAGDFAAEQAALVDCRSNGYRRQEDLERLAYLYAADGNMAEAGQILRAVDDRRRLPGTRERLLLFDSLIATRAPADALRRGIRWYKGQPDEDFALEMITRLVAAERNDLAFQMARDIGAPGDAVTLAAGEILVDQVQYDAARSFLTGWLTAASGMSAETATRFVVASVDAEAADLGLKGAEQFGLTRFRPEVLVQLAEALLAARNPAGFDKVTAVLSPEAIAGAGLVAAAIELRAGRLDAARVLLSGVSVDPADERRAALRAQLTALAGRSPAVTALIREPARTELIVGTPAVTTAPGETRTRRISVPVEVARRFKRRRLAVKGTAPSVSVNGKSNQSASPYFVPAPFPGGGN